MFEPSPVTMRQRSTQYQRALLLPLTIAIAVLMTTVVIAEYFRENQALETERERNVAAVRDAFGLAISRDSDKLGATLKPIIRNAYLRNFFLNGERRGLHDATDELFEALRRDHGITHFYFIDRNRKMFLRVQRPESFGDQIDRTTLLQAEQSGKAASGLELGQKGVFTLRVVEPWLDEVGNRIGYIELGMEIDRTLAQLHELTGVDLFLLVDKRFLNRDQWEEGMDMVGHLRDWDLIPDKVVAGRTRNANDVLLAAHPGFQSGGAALEGRHRAHSAGRSIEFSSQPLTDASGRTLGLVLMAHDLTAMESRQQRFLAIIVAAALVFGTAVLLITNRALARIFAEQNAVAETEEKARKAAG
ncbi:MAG TPA: cache domain-containing protein [Aromatoleum sp.]|uniref:cache domain-containing protein n=1 Tax=Aromatoleum sp. TaxID=2307007 RepID=UPI002B45A465|nr:cache domain-containing protein [Aromatoleum sp.]HJV28506.1 cache domain-containing protein [Aromatoleum sp.]